MHAVVSASTRAVARAGHPLIFRLGFIRTSPRISLVRLRAFRLGRSSPSREQTSSSLPGLLSSLCCIALIFDMIVAIATVQPATIAKGLSFIDWLDDFLYLPEVLYIIIFIWLICAGPGRASVDHAVGRQIAPSAG